MSYEIHLNIPEDSQWGHLITFLTSEQHITPNQAIERIIDQAVQSRGLSTEDEPLTVKEKETMEDATEARRKHTAERQARREALAKARPETPDALIGYLADAPQVAESIRQLAYERRSRAFGNF